MTWITAKFPQLPEAAQGRVRAYVTTRQLNTQNGGASYSSYSSFNLATHVGDDSSAVTTNRALLREELELPTEPYWLKQTHSSNVVILPDQYNSEMETDASVTSKTNTISAVMTADCLPLLVVDENATQVAAIHAGWRGLTAGIIEKTLAEFAAPAKALHVYLGPAIGPEAFEVGADVKAAFEARHPDFVQAFKSREQAGKYLADLYALARLELTRLGVKHVSGGEFCTFSQAELFYSYRRDGQTGRMASLIWLLD